MCVLQRTWSEPVIALEVSPQADSHNQHQDEKQRVGPPPLKGRHVLEVHAVDPCEESQREEDRRNDREQAETSICLVIGYAILDTMHLRQTRVFYSFYYIQG